MDETTNSALKEVALLVCVGQDMYDMADTFRNSQELDLEAAKPHAGAVVHFAKRAATLLLDAMLHRSDRRAHALAEARHICVRELTQAIAHAETLSNMEAEAMRQVGGAGNFIQFKILSPLQSLGWQSIKGKIDNATSSVGQGLRQGV